MLYFFSLFLILSWSDSQLISSWQFKSIHEEMEPLMYCITFIVLLPREREMRCETLHDALYSVQILILYFSCMFLGLSCIQLTSHELTTNCKRLLRQYKSRKDEGSHGLHCLYCPFLSREREVRDETLYNIFQRLHYVLLKIMLYFPRMFLIVSRGNSHLTSSRWTVKDY